MRLLRALDVPWLLFLAAMLALSLVLGLIAPRGAAAREVQIPEASWQYRRAVESASVEYFGLHASPARLAAQLHAESGWRSDARSPYAEGLAQFVPATARWLPAICPELGAFDPWDPWQSVRAAACYDAWLHRRVVLRAAGACDSWALTLCAYNGGERWCRRDASLAAAAGADPTRWFGHVELYTARADWARRENRQYVSRILLTLEPAYLAAGWPGEAVCP